MKRCFAFLSVLVLLLTCVTPVLAAEGNVTYSGDAGAFFFAPGSEQSLTDLFPDFKDVMPGDTLTQQITLKNDASNQVKVKVYLRALGAREGSEEFLSQLHLQVAKSEENTMAYMFDAAANETAQLTDWVCLGMLYSGGEVNLDVTLEVPVTMDNAFKQQVGYLDWEFMIEEFEIEPSDPENPNTGDQMPVWPLFGLITLSLFALIVLLLPRKRRKEAQ